MARELWHQLPANERCAASAQEVGDDPLSHIVEPDDGVAGPMFAYRARNVGRRRAEADRR